MKKIKEKNWKNTFLEIEEIASIMQSWIDSINEKKLIRKGEWKDQKGKIICKLAIRRENENKNN